MSVDNLIAHVGTLANRKGRAVNTAGHRKAKEYILNHLSVTSLRPYTGNSFEVPYESGRQTFTNIIGIIEGQDRELAPILLGTHYDTIPGTPGADDNAAAVGVLLEMVKDMKIYPIFLLLRTKILL